MGSKYDFEHHYKYNYDSQVSLTINLPKTCYSKGEFIDGNLFLKTKQFMQETILLNPLANASLTELHNRGQPETDFDVYDQKNQSQKKSLEEEITLFIYEMGLKSYSGSNLFLGISIPFHFQIPEKCNPSCIFDSNTYIRHLLTFDFVSIKAKKTAIIIIKNDKYFSLENKLYKSPSIYTRKVSKHQYAIFSKGSFTASLKLAKNSFQYDEIIPFIVEIDCSNLNIQVKNIKVSLNLMLTVQNYLNITEISSQKIKEIVTKIIPLTKGDKKYIIDDVIKLPSTMDNPKEIYKKLDSDKRKFSEKFKNIFLCPSLYNEILKCEYFIKVMLEMDTMFSTNESLSMPIEFYENDNSQKRNSLNNSNVANNVNDENNFVDEYVEQLPNLMELEQSNINNSIINQQNNINYNNNNNLNYNNQQPIYSSFGNFNNNSNVVNINEVEPDNNNVNTNSNGKNTPYRFQDFEAPPSISQTFVLNHNNKNDF